MWLHRLKQQTLPVRSFHFGMLEIPQQAVENTLKDNLHAPRSNFWMHRWVCTINMPCPVRRRRPRHLTRRGWGEGGRSSSCCCLAKFGIANFITNSNIQKFEEMSIECCQPLTRQAHYKIRLASGVIGIDLDNEHLWYIFQKR